AINQGLGLPPLPSGKADGFDIPFGRIDLVGITLDLFGAHGLQGPRNLVEFGRTRGLGDVNSGHNLAVDTAGHTLLGGTTVPEGWVVVPHPSADGSITAADVTGIIERGIAEARRVRSAIRVPLNSTARMIFAVTDKQGNVLGLYRMP